jgi:hypothetical protein
MRDFKEPYYEGPECVCCKTDYEKIISFLENLDSTCADWAISVIKDKYGNR